MNVIKLHGHVAANLLRITKVKLLCVRCLEIRIKHSSPSTRQRIYQRTWDNGWWRIDVQIRIIIQEGCINLRIRLLHGEERYVQERLIVVDTISTTKHRLRITPKIPGESNSRAEVVFVVFNYFTCPGTTDNLKCSKRAIFGSVGVVDEANINIIASAEIESEPRSDFPVVLHVEGELLWIFTQVKAWVTSGKNNRTNDSDTVQISGSPRSDRHRRSSS